MQRKKLRRDRRRSAGTTLPSAVPGTVFFPVNEHSTDLPKKGSHTAPFRQTSLSERVLNSVPLPGNTSSARFATIARSKVTSASKATARVRGGAHELF
jgi:hypothetical protein